jgi:hypothetical protein
MNDLSELQGMIRREDWQPITTIEETDLQISYPWQFVTEIVGDWKILELLAKGEWDCLGDAVKPCGADGHPDLFFPEARLILPACAPGTLIGKFGGSAAARTGDSTAFAIGSQCVIAMPDKKSAQLLIGVNGALPRARLTLQTLRLEISGVDQL